MFGDNIYDLELFLDQNKQIVGGIFLGNNFGYRDKNLGFEKNGSYFLNLVV